MPVHSKADYGDAGFIFSAVAAWSLSALILTLLAAFIVCRLDLGQAALGYISSALSYAAAVFAGSAAVRSGKTGAMYAAMVSAAVIVIGLLTVGFIIKGAEIESSAVISVVSFSFVGCMTGAVFFGKRKKVRRNAPKP